MLGVFYPPVDLVPNPARISKSYGKEHEILADFFLCRDRFFMPGHSPVKKLVERSEHSEVMSFDVM